MCRFLAYASTTDQAITGLLSPEEFAEFTAMSKLHGDGWGMAWLPGNQRGEEAHVGSTRSVNRAIDDMNDTTFASTPMGRAGMAHIRWATPGFAVNEENSHPFRIDEWAFVHNGAIPNSDRIDELLSPASKARLDYHHDSRRLFLLLVQRIEEHGDIAAGVRHAVDDIRARCETGSLNAVLMNDTVMIILQAQGETEPPVSSLLRAVNDPSELPDGHDENYYKLRFCQRGSSLIVTSTGITTPGWTLLEDDSLFLIDLDTHDVTLTPLASTTPSDTLSLA